jgi:hypothetical protein
MKENKQLRMEATNYRTQVEVLSSKARNALSSGSLPMSLSSSSINSALDIQAKKRPLGDTTDDNSKKMINLTSEPVLDTNTPSSTYLSNIV